MTLSSKRSRASMPSVRGVANAHVAEVSRSVGSAIALCIQTNFLTLRSCFLSVPSR